jgi:hypothetical protein
VRFAGAVLTLVTAALLAVGAQARPDGLVRAVGGAEVDWSEGTVTTSAGAAADLRMPSADVARPGAERRAKAAALEKLRAALKALPVNSGEKLDASLIENALAHAQITRREYQSNGGVVLWAAVRFADLATPGKPAPALVLSVPNMPFELAPQLNSAGNKQARVAYATYRQGKPAGDAILVQRDKKGRLVLPEDAGLDQFADAPVAIYVHKAAP